MTTTALKVKSTPMAPYIGLMREMSRRDIKIVVSFLNEIMEESEQPRKTASPKTSAELISEKYKGQKISPRVMWYMDCLSDTSEWNTQEAWEKLTDEQREQAKRLNLTSDDIDERTFSILTE